MAQLKQGKCFEGGLYVIVHNDIMRYPFQHQLDDPRFSTKSGMYEEDVEKIRHTFGITDSNLLERHNVTRTDRTDQTDQSNCFDSFIKKDVLQGNRQPEFLMFFLMSVGIKHGQFLLSSNGVAPCCEIGKHELENHCHGRRISKLVKDIQTSQEFSGVPKIFMIQTYTGSERGGIIKQGPKEDAPDMDDYIPRGSDTLVFYLNIDQTLDWVKENNSDLMMQTLCQKFSEIPKNVTDKCGEIKIYLQTLDIRTGREDHGKKDLIKLKEHIESKLEIPLQLELESLSHSWLMDVLMSVTSHMTSKHDELKPQISSTLRSKLSALELTAAGREIDSANK